MKFVIFGLSVSSSWGNGHATLWRGLCSALGRRGHHVTFFERDVPYYSDTRDLTELPGGGDLVLYSDWNEIAQKTAKALETADVGMVTSYCPDALTATPAVLDSRAALKVFYDLDSPITLSRMERGENVAYVGSRGYSDFDLVLSYVGGVTLDLLRVVLGAARVAPLYGSVDPEVHKPANSVPSFSGDFSYLGTYSSDRSEALLKFFIEPAVKCPEKRFVMGGAMYDHSFPWQPNIFMLNHMPPAEHSAFYCSSKITLNVTRGPMAKRGYCPSGRIFEAAACGIPVFSDEWDGLDSFYQPGSEILVGRTTEDVLATLDKSPEELIALGTSARERTMQCHTSQKRVEDLERIVQDCWSRERVPELVCGA